MLSFAFFVGIVLSLLALGTAAAYLGRVLAQWSAAFALGAAIFSLVAGLAALLGAGRRRPIPDPGRAPHGGGAGARAFGDSATACAPPRPPPRALFVADDCRSDRAPGLRRAAFTLLRGRAWRAVSAAGIICGDSRGVACADGSVAADRRGRERSRAARARGIFRAAGAYASLSQF